MRKFTAISRRSGAASLAGVLAAVGLVALGVQSARAQDADAMMPSVPTYEGYAVALAKLSGLDAMRERRSNRSYADVRETGFWADWQASRATLAPVTSTAGNSSYEVRDTTFNLGVDMPVSDALLFGTSFSLSQADAKVSSLIGNGDIALEGFSLAATATWFPGERQRDRGLYAEGRLQYASLEGDLKSGDTALTTKNEAVTIGVAAEIGYRQPLGPAGLAITPQAQLDWTNVDFDDFTDPDGLRVALVDGDILAARVGFALDREWSLDDQEGHFYGSVNLRLPLDGETATKVAADTVTSELEEMSLDFAAGASWAWGERYALIAEAGTAQGDETEEYRGSLGIRFGF